MDCKHSSLFACRLHYDKLIHLVESSTNAYSQTIYFTVTVRSL